MALRADDVDLDRDRGLVRRFQAGDGEAFDELYRRYYDRLERFCRRRVQDHHTAEEIAQEAFARALTALPDLGGDRRFYPWVSVIAAHLCVDWHRRQARSEPNPDPDPGAVAGGQEAIVDAVDVTLAVAALGRLAPRHQDVLQLREIEGWSYRRIADHYGVSVGTVETLLFRARHALRREFRLIEGGSLAAIPVLGWAVRGATHLRWAKWLRLPRWLAARSPITVVAATATASAAALALVLIPVTVPPPANPPAAITPSRQPGWPSRSAPTSPVRQGTGAVADGVATAPTSTAASGAGATNTTVGGFPAPGTGTVPAATATLASTTAGSSPGATTTTTLPGATLSVGGNLGPTLTAPIVGLGSTLTLPSLGGVTGALSLPVGVPPVTLAPVGTTMDGVTDSVNNLLGGLLPGKH